jgi:VWFA-related protein
MAMYPQKSRNSSSFPGPGGRGRGFAAALAAVLMVLIAAGALLLSAGKLRAQSTQTPSNQQDPKKPQQPTPGEAGGPQGDIGPIAVPKKKEDTPTAPPRRPPAEKMPEFTITADVPLVTLDVLVTSKDGHFIPNLKKEHFKVLEDGVPQKVSNFAQAEAPITAVLLVEFANTPLINYTRDWLVASYSFAQGLKKDDWVAVIAYDMRPEILADFTQDKRNIYAALSRLRIPSFSETNMFDALYDTLDRVEGIEGRKYVILVSSGCDSFSKLTYDKILKKVQSTPNVSIYSVGTGRALREWADAHGYMRALSCNGAMLNDSAVNRLDFLQADNQMTTFARLTGGRAYFPRFEAEFPEIFADIANSIRNEYTVAYHPTNPKLDGSYRKLKVELVDTGGQPLKMRDEKGKEVKYQIIAREGYTAKHQVD